MEWSGVSSNADVVLNHCGEEGAQPEGKALDVGKIQLNTLNQNARTVQ